jgi:exodeoxyribonuclease-3
VFCRETPLGVEYGIGRPEHNGEGRVITLEYEDFYLVNVYVPNSGEELKRLEYRMQWEDDFRAYFTGLDQKKPVIACGDFNVAHREIDLKNPSANRRHAGFTDEEREKFSRLLEAGFTDAFRLLFPDLADQYTYWSYRFNSRSRNAGWRIDYGCISNRIRDDLKAFTIHSAVYGSDHCPISFDIF